MSRRTTLLLLLALSAGHAQAADLVASVDRSRLNSGETVELTVQSSDVTQFGKPDLSPLDAQFEVSGTRQINQLTTLDGDNHATTRWIITLLPKVNGNVVIPPLQVGALKTQPITLQVVESASQNTSAWLQLEELLFPKILGGDGRLEATAAELAERMDGVLADES